MRLTVFLLALCSMLPGASRFWVGGGATTNWNATGNTNWSATSGGANNASVPGSGDDVFFDANSNAGSPAVISAAIEIKSLDCTGYTGTLTHNSAITLTIDNSLTFSSGMTYTLGNANSSAITIGTTATGALNTLTFAGKTVGNFTISAPVAGATDKWTLQDAFAQGAGAAFNLTRGTFDTGNQVMTVGTFNSSNSNTRSIILGTSIITVAGVGASAWTLQNITNLTFSGASSTINMTNAGNTPGSDATFFGGSQTYGTLAWTGGGTGIKTIAGNNTFSVLVINRPKHVTFTASQTQTITTFTAIGISASVITIDSNSAGTAATLSVASGQVCSDWLSLKDSAATGGAAFFAGANSTNVSGNTGWTFTACPAFVPTVSNFVVGP